MAWTAKALGGGTLVITDIVNYYSLPTTGVIEGSLALLPYGTYKWKGTGWNLLAPSSYQISFTAMVAIVTIDTFRLEKSFAFVLEP